MGQSFKNLVAWQKAMDLVVEIYAAAEKFPRHELYGLTSQMRRAAVSVPSNIAEGQAHYSRLEFRHFLRHARGSLAELETQVLIAERLKYLDHETSLRLTRLAEEVGRIINGLIASTRSQASQAS
ncbi:MAG: four helix bundle protein [Terriglobales bacterium]